MTATCRICLEGGELIQPCSCKGTAANVHAKCLLRWLAVSGRTSCEICKHPYDIEEEVESRCILCPSFRTADTNSFQNLVFVVGFIFFFLMSAFALLSELSVEVFVVVNLMQPLLLFCMDCEDMHPGESLFVWKIMSSSAFGLAVWIDKWTDLACLEWILTACIGIVVYVKLATQQQTNQVLYLDYINEADP